MTPNTPPADAPRHDALPPGSTLDGYVVERSLASSRLGHVYQARDTATGQRVAVKEYLPVTLAERSTEGPTVQPRADGRDAAHEAAFERGRAAFLEEAQLLRRCRHASLLGVLRAWPENGTVYRAMPLHTGQRLDELRRGMAEPPDEPALWALLDGLLGALDTLHGANAVHGDLRPSRVLLLGDDTPLLMDGAAVRRAIAGESQPLRGDDAARAEDLHALAELVVWCIAGDTPAPARGGMVQPNEPLEALVDRQQARYPGLHYSAGFVNAIDAVLSAPPRQRVRSVARFRALLEGDDSGDTVSLADLQPLFSGPAAVPVAPAPVQRVRADDPAQARTLAALQVALDSIATDAPARTPPRSAPVPLSAGQAPFRPVPPRGPRVGLLLAGIGVLLAGAAAAWLLLGREPVMPVAVPAPTPVLAPQAVTEVAPAPAIAVASAPAAEAPAEPAVVALPTPTEAPLVVSTPKAAASAPAVPVLAAPAPVPAPPPASAPEPKPVAAPQPAPKTVPKPASKPLPTAAAPPATASPRAACGARSEFSLYRCMQTQCKAAQWAQHPQCVKLRSTDVVD